MSKSAKRAIVVVHDYSCSDPYQTLAVAKNLTLSPDPELLFRDPGRVAHVVFTGGEDVGPELYGKSKHPTTHDSPQRDYAEQRIFDQAYKLGIPMSGICRGAQLLCVMAGGELVQDITGHGRDHDLLVELDGRVERVPVNSAHHQMQNPFYRLRPDQYQLVGWMEKPLSKWYGLDKTEEIAVEDADKFLVQEPDIVYYPEIRALATQYHPEWLSRRHPAWHLYTRLLNAFVAPLIDNDETRTATA